ncbi:restriction endonuclease subunit S [Bifidobacterium pseudocatenulatum]|uniref:restriction endonuclease subunit S n=4 Tax=Bifidobacterium pseudocatenulatum TaxID=28026 RepID=UPI003569C064
MACEVEWIPLGDIVNLSSGGTPDKKQPAYWDGEIPWISAKTLTGDTVTTSNLFITEEGLHAGSKLAPVGSILLLTRGSGLFKRIPLAIVNAPVAYNQDVKCMTSKVTTITNEYVFFALKALSPELTNMLETTGIGAGKLATDRLLDMPIPVLSHDEREKAVSFFSALSRKIMINNRINDYLADFASTVFQNQASHIEERIALFDIADIKYGKGLAKNELVEDGYPVFGGNGQIGFYSKYLYEEPQILISCRGAASGKVLVSLPKSFITSNSLIIELKDRRYYEYLKQYFMLHQLYDYATGSAQPQITIDGLRHLTVPYPPFDLIKTLTNQLKAISDCIYSNDIENQALSRLRDTLLPKLMSGEIDVSKVDLTQLTNNHLTVR